MAEVSSDKATFDNVVLPLAQDEAKVSLEAYVIYFYQSVSTDRSLRDASTEAMALYDAELYNESASRARASISDLFDAVFKRGEQLDSESQRLLEVYRKGSLRSGLGLPEGPKRKQFDEIQARLAKIITEFQNNLNTNDEVEWLTPEELDGVPKDIISNLQKGTGANDGKLRLPLKGQEPSSALRHATNADTRQKIYLAIGNKCKENIPLFKEAVILRDKAARMLGYKSHAHFMIEDTMLKTPEAVNSFLGDLRHRLTLAGQDDVAKLKSTKQQHLKNSTDSRFYLWDESFYRRLMLEKDLSFDREKVKEYFPFGPTFHRMVKIFEELFGLDFVEITGEDRDKLAETGKGADTVWHKDVQVFAVWNDEGEGGGFVGYLYVDPYLRDNKFSGAANFNLHPGFIDEKGLRRYPATGETRHYNFLCKHTLTVLERWCAIFQRRQRRSQVY